MTGPTPASDPPDLSNEAPIHGRGKRPRAVTVIVASLAAGAGDALILHSSGRSWSSAVGAGVVMTFFVAAGIWWMQRVLAARRPRRSDGPSSGGWARPDRGQRASRFVKRLRSGGLSRENPLAGGVRKRRR